MSASIWSPGSELIVAGNNSTAVQNFNATPGQTVFILTSFSYAVGENSIDVYYNGVYQRLGIDYQETASDRITFLSSPFVTGDTLTIVGRTEMILSIAAPLSDALPKALGAASAGILVEASRADHVHPTDDSKAELIHTHTASGITDFSEAVDDRVAALLVAGTNVTLTYNDVANTLTVAAATGGGGVAWGAITGTLSAQTDLQNALNAKAPLASPTFTGTVGLPAATVLTNPTITNFTETRHAPAAGSAFTVNLANGTIQRFTTNANATITLPSSVAGKSYVIEIAYGGVHTVTWAGGSVIKWAGGSAPTATSVNGKIDRYVFSCDGTNTLGSDGGRNF